MAKLNMTLGELRALLGEGELVGDAEFALNELAGLEDAGPRDLSFVKGRKHLSAALTSRAGALLVPERIEEASAHQIVLAEPFVALTRVLSGIAAKKRAREPGIHPAATVHPSAKIGSGVYLGPGTVVEEDAIVGDDTTLEANAFVGPRCALGVSCVIHPGVILREDVELGARVVVRSGTVIGSEGYGFLPTDGRPVRVPQVGGVRIGDDVEIGALAAIDGATFGWTVIGEGCKFGDYVHVGHNCKIGKNVMLLPLTAISGSVEIGDGALLAAASRCADNLTIGAGARVGAGSVLLKDVAAGDVVWGRPARPKMLETRIQSLLNRLPELFRDVAKLKGD